MFRPHNFYSPLVIALRVSPYRAFRSSSSLYNFVVDVVPSKAPAYSSSNLPFDVCKSLGIYTCRAADQVHLQNIVEPGEVSLS
jgi:hypothetical protein